MNLFERDPITMMLLSDMNLYISQYLESRFGAGITNWQLDTDLVHTFFYFKGMPPAYSNRDAKQITVKCIVYRQNKKMHTVTDDLPTLGEMIEKGRAAAQLEQALLQAKLTAIDFFTSLYVSSFRMPGDRAVELAKKFVNNQEPDALIAFEPTVPEGQGLIKKAIAFQLQG